MTQTGMNEARTDYLLGFVNVALALTDAGVALKSMKGAGSLGSIKNLTKLKGSQIQEVVGALRTGGVEKAREVLAQVKDLPQQAREEILRTLNQVVHPQGELVTPEGVRVQSGEVEKPQPMQTRGTGSSQGVAVANPNVPAEVAAKWSQTKNWNEVESFLGEQAGDKLPPGYNYSHDGSRINRAKGRGNDAEMVPLQIGEDGTFQITTQIGNRISIPRVMRKNFETAYGKLKDGYWIHHLIPDEVMRSNALAKFSRQIGRYNLDRASNLEGLAAKEEWAKIRTGQAEAPTSGGYSGKVGHWSSHDDYSEDVKVYLNAELKRLKNKFGDLNQAIKDPKKKQQLIQEVDQAMEDTENEFRSRVQKGNVPHTPDGRMTWNNEQTEPTA